MDEAEEIRATGTDEIVPLPVPLRPVRKVVKRSETVRKANSGEKAASPCHRQKILQN